MVEIHKLVRSKRKTLALVVETDGTLTVRAPLRMKESDILRFIDAKQDWIKRKQSQVQVVASRRRQYVDGEMFLYLGEEIPLRIIPGGKQALVLESNFKLTKSSQQQAESIFKHWYKEQARIVLTERISLFADNHQFAFPKIRISNARTRWGSCSAKGVLSFTWRLVMAPLDVIDYVIVHELCHLKEMNHSKTFWALVEAILPDYKLRRKWLKKYGGTLNL